MRDIGGGRSFDRLLSVRLPVVGLAAFWLLLLITACAPRVQETGPAQHRPALSAERYLTADGLKLKVKQHAAGEPRAVIVALHGFNDYRAAFDEAGEWWSDNNITVYAYDQRSFGSAPMRGIWPGDERLIADARAVVALVRDRHPGLPVYLLGVSMGGAVALAAAAGEPPVAADGIILVAPAVWGWSNLNPVYRGALWLAAHTVPGNKMTGQGLGIVASDNLAMLRALGSDPLVIKETRTDAVYGLVGLMERAYRAAGHVKLPSLLLYGARDELIPKGPVDRVAAQLPPPRRVAIYADGYHMLLRDLQAEIVWRDIAAWVADPGAPLPSGYERPEQRAGLGGIQQLP